MRAGRPLDFNEVLQSAKMGEAYSYRDSQPVKNNLRCPTAHLNADSPNTGLAQELSELRGQVRELTEVVKTLKLKDSKSISQDVSDKSIRTCYKCGEKGHVSVFMEWRR